MRLTMTVLVVLTAVSGLPAQDAPKPGRVLEPNQVVATVNDEMILVREVLKRIAPTLAREEDPRERLRLVDLQILQLVRRELQKKGAKNLNLYVGERDIDREVAKKKKELEGQGLALEAILAEQGMSLQDYRRMLREDLLIEAFQMTVAGLAPRTQVALRPRHDSFVRPRELRDFYRAHADEFRVAEQVRIRTIYIGAGDFLKVGMEIAEAKRHARNHAKEILGRVEGGEEFEALARAYSRDQYREAGGDQGFKEKDGLPDYLRVWAFREKAGTVSALLETRSGFAIARIEERKEARILPFEEVQESIRRRLASQRRGRNVARATLDLLEESDVTPDRYALLMRQDLMREIEGR